MFIRRSDPGPCPVCGAPHSACVESGGQVIRVDILPASNANARAAALAAGDRPLVAEQVQATLPEGQVTSGTYRGTKRVRRKEPTP